MAMNQDLPATDSAAALHEIIGDDSTATFENDPKFVESTGADTSSSENLQTQSDRSEVAGRPALVARDTDDVEDEDEDEEDDDDELEDDEDDDEDLDDEDLDDEDDDEDDEDDDEEDEDEE